MNFQIALCHAFRYLKKNYKLYELCFCGEIKQKTKEIGYRLILALIQQKSFSKEQMYNLYCNQWPKSYRTCWFLLVFFPDSFYMCLNMSKNNMSQNI